MRARTSLRSTPMAAALATTLGLALWAPSAVAAESERGEKWQFTIPMTFTSGTTVDGQQGTNFKMNDDLGWGFGFGYNLNPHFMVGVDFTWLSANYNAHITFDNDGNGIPDSSADLSGTLDAASMQFVGQYNILKGRVTPYLRASFGWTWIDSNIPSGPPQGSCWWDPWYGYICNSWQPTYEDTALTYGAAAGVHAEIAQRFFLEDRAGTPSLDGFRFTLGWSF
jgi:hypothetical protein